MPAGKRDANDNLKKIRELSRELTPQLVEIRRHLHQYPELSFQEFKTTEYLQEWLEKAGLEIHTEYADTGVVGILRGGESGCVVALRGDIDALPLEEKTGLEYASRNPGVMHACRHDRHATVVVGAALILSKLRDSLPGAVKFILQPGEEKNPGGASIMIKRGVLENPPVDVIFGLHSDPRFRVGEIGYKEGVMMAEPDEFYITIKARGGHGSAPHLTTDPIVIAAEVVLALQKIPSRIIDPYEHVVVTVGKIAGGHTTNVIPDTVELVGTVRTFRREIAEHVEELMRKILTGITMAYDADFDMRFDYGYPPLVNDEEATRFLVERGKEYLGEERCHHLDRPSFGGEDFAFYLQKVKGTFFRLGTGNPDKGITAYWHNSSYTVDEDALPVGAGFLAYLAYSYLKNHENNQD